MTTKIRTTDKSARPAKGGNAKGQAKVVGVAQAEQPVATAKTTKTVTTITTVTTALAPESPQGAGTPATPQADGAGSTEMKKRWAYAYQIIPPQAEDRLKAVRALIEKEMQEARKAARTWQGRFIPEQLITHLLVVSDTPDQAGELNQRLEMALTALQTTFVRTTPFAIDDGVELGAAGSTLSPMLAPLVGDDKKKS